MITEAQKHIISFNIKNKDSTVVYDLVRTKWWGEKLWPSQNGQKVNIDDHGDENDPLTSEELTDYIASIAKYPGFDKSQLKGMYKVPNDVEAERQKVIAEKQKQQTDRDSIAKLLRNLESKQFTTKPKPLTEVEEIRQENTKHRTEITEILQNLPDAKTTPTPVKPKDELSSVNDLINRVSLFAQTTQVTKLPTIEQLIDSTIVPKLIQQAENCNNLDDIADVVQTVLGQKDWWYTAWSFQNKSYTIDQLKYNNKPLTRDDFIKLLVKSLNSNKIEFKSGESIPKKNNVINNIVLCLNDTGRGALLAKREQNQTITTSVTEYDDKPRFVYEKTSPVRTVAKVYRQKVGTKKVVMEGRVGLSGEDNYEDTLKLFSYSKTELHLPEKYQNRSEITCLSWLSGKEKQKLVVGYADGTLNVFHVKDNGKLSVSINTMEKGSNKKVFIGGKIPRHAIIRDEKSAYIFSDGGSIYKIGTKVKSTKSNRLIEVLKGQRKGKVLAVYQQNSTVHLLLEDGFQLLKPEKKGITVLMNYAYNVSELEKNKKETDLKKQLMPVSATLAVELSQGGWAVGLKDGRVGYTKANDYRLKKFGISAGVSAMIEHQGGLYIGFETGELVRLNLNTGQFAKISLTTETHKPVRQIKIENNVAIVFHQGIDEPNKQQENLRKPTLTNSKR